jgi:hypothetical protein
MVTSEAVIQARQRWKRCLRSCPNTKSIGAYERSGNNQLMNTQSILLQLAQLKNNFCTSPFSGICYAGLSPTQSVDLMEDKGNVGIYIDGCQHLYPHRSIRRGQGLHRRLANNATFLELLLPALVCVAPASIPPTSVFGDFIASNEPFSRSPSPLVSLLLQLEELNDYGK